MNNSQILVVDDESVVALDVNSRLQHLGYTVAAVASSGEEAVERTAETRPDLVLMDIKMPGGMDGIKAAEQIRERFDIPVVFCSAYGDEGTLERAKITGPFGYILKPFEERDLRVAIEVALHKHKMDQELKQRVRELTALNQMFQKHLMERFAIVEAYRDVLDGLEKLVPDINILVERARSQPIPELEVASDLVPDESIDTTD